LIKQGKGRETLKKKKKRLHCECDVAVKITKTSTTTSTIFFLNEILVVDFVMM